MYESGTPMAEIAKSLSVSVNTISRAVKRAGVKPTHKNYKIQESIKVKGKCLYDYNAIATAYASGLSAPKVSERFGCTGTTVLRALAATGTPPRTISEGVSLASRGNKRLINGYIGVSIAKYVRKMEHILIAEESLGRKLNRNECVHHINQNRADNRRENLLICTRGYHTALHARMRKHPEWQKTGE
jgi:DNA-binding Lrp family transcriptional regulator